MRAAIEKRTSKRSFTTQKLTADQISKIENMVTQINEKSGLTFEFIEDGSAGFTNFKKSYGFFKNVRSMILTKGNINLPHLKEKIGYYGEEIMLDLVDMGYGTCWVGGTLDRDAFMINEDEDLACVILVGYAESRSLKNKLTASRTRIIRKPISERIISDCELPEWLENGMQAVVLAPTARNSQKVHFDYKDEVLTASVADDYIRDLVDLGIAKKHFEIEAGGHFEWGNGAKYFRVD